ncbi:glycoside hydrolase superfamily [Rhodofomes roseus]|uniref:Beta-mannosidase B n=1 Tax=Rhodofomes roseus TaxID=34475 RepID=A0ABQ8K3K4_9APHY|nr:glycoside hydrolase superfamily [Rhodofomes roseus]KAH9831470.1 glycoside hydrolase superfamily [Rhodofomes roseus]
MASRTVSLDRCWYWKERDANLYASALDEVPRDALQPGSRWTAAQSFPSEIHAELVKAGRIPDPFIGFNEHEVQWVGEREWLYYCSFSLPQQPQGAIGVSYAELQFEGLDTVCDVFLNGDLLLSTDNMFRIYTVPLDASSLHADGNSLLLRFKSARLVAKELEAKYGRVRAGSTNLGDPSRVYVRKAQYGWRWDWGPELMTCGPYRPINLVVYTTRISTLYSRAAVSAAPSLAPSLAVDVEISGRVADAQNVRVVLMKEGSNVVLKQEVVPIPQSEGSSTLRKADDVIAWNLQDVVDLWWPVGYGAQHLYTVEVTLLAKDSAVLDVVTTRVGFRRVESIQEPLKEPDQYGKGTTFLFEVNGVRMFMGGSNWIPAHSFLTELTPERYRAWLALLKDGNQNMVRLWGGGVYEPDVFYDTCDELGILVWQDFQFACGVYPAHDEFVESVRREAEDNVKRLRQHPSLVLLCGNNEDYQQVLQWGGISELPARRIYEQVLPEVVERLTSPPIPYHRGSPYGGEGWDTTDPTIGDVHQWDIWAGKERPWQEYGERGGRFVSEFGIPSFPEIRTVDYWLAGNTEERHAQSKLMAQHNRAGNHERRFAILMNENFRVTSDFETHVYNTQLMQSEAVSFAYRIWRRAWKGKGKEYTAGALVWQLNDCWPVTSWAIADFFLRAKPVYYTIKRELAPLSVGILRSVHKNRENDRPKQFYEFGAFRSVEATIEVWACNSTLQPRQVKLVLQCVDLNSAWSHQQESVAILHPNQSTELLHIPCPCPPSATSSGLGPGLTTSHSVVVAARLVDVQTGGILARHADWPQPFKYIDPPDPGLQFNRTGERISVRADKPVKALVLSTDDEVGGLVQWSDNALDLVPGDEQVVLARGIGNGVLWYKYFGSMSERVVA